MSDAALKVTTTTARSSSSTMSLPARILAAIGEPVSEAITYIGAITSLSWRCLVAITRRPLGLADILVQCEVLGNRSLPIAAFIMFFVGLVFAFQFGITLSTMGAVPYIGKVVSLSIIRELGPVFVALVAGGRIGAGIAAELGSMRVTEQIDAILALGADPDKKLLVPRVVACTFMLPLVSLVGDVMGIAGGTLISWVEFGVTPRAFFEAAISTIHLTDFASGFLKPYFFGFGVAIIGCYHGYTCEEGTVGVGKATTKSVVNIAIMVVLVDFLLTRVFAFFPRI